ncbi:ATP-binding protein [Streptosporangium subroseum]|uniref:ATP-binding protein n=1 Tax=Streptosporangium subroseum TaxID=106412 RepID=UPI0030907EAB|nr:ATP-binding protein [Streptosporangium subroseum]
MPPGPGIVTPQASGQDLAVLDARFAELRDTAKVAAALSPATEDTVMPALLSAGLSAWITEQGKAGQVFNQDPPPSSKPPLHARLRRSLDETTEDEAHWGFRAVASENANAALNRLRKASVAAGLDLNVPKRRLFLLRNASWGKGPRTLEAVAAFEQAGGRILRVDPEDLRILSALRDLLHENPPHLQAWLTTRRPAGDVKLLGEALGDVWTVPDEQRGHGVSGRHDHPTPAERSSPTTPGGQPDRPTPGERSGYTAPGMRPDAVVLPAHVSPGGHPVQATLSVQPPSTVTTTSFTTSPVPYIALGRAIDNDSPVSVELESLRKHTAIFAGSGSGKTVLIRNLIEKCALQGVSAIVLDPNNDLARLGDPWPEAPEHWAAGDAARAADYLANTDVVVWTPGRRLGRPLSFQPLPDFASVLDDADEFNEAIEVAVASIVPRAKLNANTHKAQLGQAVLRETLKYYARQGGPTSLEGLIDMLSELPDGVSGLANADRLAADLGQILAAAMVNDPMFGGTGVPVDPGLLLTPPEGKRARVSVINLAALQSDVQRQSFVNQLQMALFAWIKKHPAGDRPLGGLFVMDEAQTFAPDGAMTACTRSTLALASQARKYGLGLVFATQAPKGLNNRIPGNATTQFFGLLNSPAQIEAAKEMARAKGGGVTDISRLRSGQFYTAVEGMPFVKVQVPMCLSHHPKDPLTVEEVVKRARDSL